MDGKVNINELTDEQIKAISEFADKLDNTDAPLKDKSPDNKELEKGSGLIDDNGKLIPTQSIDDQIWGDDDRLIDLSKLSEMGDYGKLLNLSDSEVKEQIEIDPESIKECEFFNTDGYTDEDIQTVINAIDRYRSGEEFSYYSALPDKAKKFVDSTIGGSVLSDIRKPRKELTESLFELLIKYNYVYVISRQVEDDTDTELNKIYEETSGKLNDYNAAQRNFFEKECAEKAKSFRELGGDDNIAKADKLEKYSEAFKQSYTYENMLSKYKTGKIKIKKIDIDKFSTRCKEFDFKYNSNEFVINTVADTVPALVKVMDDVSEDQIKKFVVAFIKYAQNMKPENMEEHIFMYYFIMNIIWTKYVDENNSEDSEFKDIILNNIRNFIKEADL